MVFSLGIDMSTDYVIDIDSPIFFDDNLLAQTTTALLPPSHQIDPTYPGEFDENCPHSQTNNANTIPFSACSNDFSSCGQYASIASPRIPLQDSSRCSPNVLRNVLLGQSSVIYARSDQKRRRNEDKLMNSKGISSIYSPYTPPPISYSDDATLQTKATRYDVIPSQSSSVLPKKKITYTTLSAKNKPPVPFIALIG